MDQGNPAGAGLVLSPLAMTPPAEDTIFFPMMKQSPDRQQGSSLPNKEPPTPDSLPHQDEPKTLQSGTGGSPDLRQQRNTARRTSTASDLVFPSQYYIELYTERAYLQTILQGYTARSQELICQYTSAEEELAQVTEAKSRRRLKKRLSLVRSKLNRTAIQERTAMIRLGDLCLAIQNQDAWGRARVGQAAHQPRAASLDTATSYFALPAVMPLWLEPMRRPSLLDASSAEFVPQNLEACDSSSSPPTMSPSYLGSSHDEEDEPRSSPARLCIYRLIRRDDGQGHGACMDHDLMHATWDGEPLAGRNRRLSLPNMECIYPFWEEDITSE